MLWESGLDNKDESDGRGRVPNKNPLYQPVTPVLVPMQSATRTVHQTVPIVVPDVEELKEQFQQQQNMLTQIKETIKENESKLSSKGKQVEVYANRLSQIRARTKNNTARSTNAATKVTTSNVGKSLTKRSSRENLVKESESPERDKTAQSKLKLSPKGKIGELKKRLEESKIKFEERTGKEVSETKKIESIVENLRMQLEERDITIQELQKIAEQPISPNIKPDALRKTKSKTDGRPISKSTQTTRQQPNDESIEKIALQNKIYELEANILDLEESLKEKESVIDARTQAVTLLSQDLSMKGKNTLECLEETRQEMRSMQNNFVVIENQLKKELVEKDDRLTLTEEKLKKLESINFELSSKNSELEEMLSKKYSGPESDKRSLTDPAVDDKIAELNSKINVLNKELDDSNKCMIRMKLEHKSKIKALNKTIEKLKETSDEKAEILKLQTAVDEFEVIRESLQNRIAELEEEKVTEKRLKDTINELESQLQQQSEIIEKHMQTIVSLEKEKLDLYQGTQDQSILIENLYAKIQSLESECASSAQKDTQIAELNRKLAEIEDEHKIRIETMKSEHTKELGMLESYYGSRPLVGDRKEFEEYRITSELNNVQVEEQIEMLIREKQQLLEKLKSLSGVSSTESFTFENVDLQGHVTVREHTTEEQGLINELQRSVQNEREKALEYKKKIEELEESLKGMEQVNTQLKQESVEEESSKPSKSNANVKNKVKKMQMELMEGRKTIQQQNERLEELNMKLEEKEQLIKNYIEKCELYEKDDWGRENDWKNAQDDFEHLQELQKKCLSLENSLIELTEDCERLRKENIEVVHLLSEEKVKRKKLMERYHLEDLADLTTVELARSIDEGSIAGETWDWSVNDLEERVFRLVDTAEALETKLRSLEINHLQIDASPDTESLIKDLREKLEWSNVVLAGKDTEIFRLQSLLEDGSKAIENLERDVTETRMKLEEKSKTLQDVIQELNKRESQFGELSVNFDRLQESMRLEKERTSSNEAQLKQLLSTLKDMECDAAKKENELKEIQSILAEKNVDIHNLRQWLETANSDLTHSYKEHLENMDKCLRDKEQEFELLLAEKYKLVESIRNLTSTNEDIINQRVELTSKNEALEKAVEDKDKIIEELNARLAEAAKQPQENEKGVDVEELKLKIKKLAVNLKKKVQNEKDLLQQIKEYEEFVAKNEKIQQKLQEDFTEVNEKWLVEKTEKEQFKNEFTMVLSAKSRLETENANLKEMMKSMENEFDNRFQSDMSKLQQKLQEAESQLQKLCESSEVMKTKQEEDRVTISKLETELADRSASESETQKECEELRKALAETCGKLVESKYNCNELAQEKTKLENELTEAKAQMEQLKTDNSYQQAKIQEQLAVVESLETELAQTRDQLTRSEESLCFLEERRSSLETKTEAMIKQIEEDSKNAVLLNDMSNQIQILSDAEQSLKSSLRALEEKNTALENEMKELVAEKIRLEKELGEARQKLNNVNEELAKLREIEAEKSAMLTEDAEKLKTVKAEAKHKSAEIERLNKQIGLLEADLQANVENSKSVEWSLNYKIDELLKENAALTERNNELTEAKEQAAESKAPKRKKSVTFKTDETDYIRDLKGKIHEYSEEMKKSSEEIETLKMELMRERLRNEVTEVVTEAREKVESLRSTPEKVPKPQDESERKFDAATFFGSETAPKDNPFFDQENQVSVDYDSLMWDDGWGTDGHLEEQYLSAQVPDTEERLQAVEAEKKKIEEELQVVQGKYAKALKKIKEQKALCDKLQTEVNRLKSDAGFGGLDGAMMDELNSQIRAFEQREKELLKNLEAAKTEKEALLKRIDVLNAGNEKFVEMKERQDNEMERWEVKNRELLQEITELRNQLENSTGDATNESEVLRELKNKVEGLEWENCELKELLEEKQELLEMRVTPPENDEKLTKEVEELSNAKVELEKKLEEEDKKSKEMIEELQQQVAALATENETLQEILGEIKKSENRLPQAVATPPSAEPAPPAAAAGSETKIFDYFKAVPVNDVFSSVFAAPVQAEPVVEPVVERAVVTPVHAANTDQLEKELQQLKLENELLQQQLSEAQSIITTVKSERHEMTEKYRAEYESALSFHLEEKNNALQKVYELEQALAIKIEELNDISTRMRELEQAVTVKTEELNAIARGRQELEQAFGMKAEESSNMWMKINELEQVLRIKTDDLTNASARLSELESALSAKGEELNSATVAVADLQERLRVKELESSNAMMELAVKSDELNKQSLRVKELESECSDRLASIESMKKMNEDLLRNAEHRIPLESEIESLNRSLIAEKSAVEDLNRTVWEKEEIIRRLTEEMDALHARLAEAEEKMKEAVRSYDAQRALAEEYCDAKEKLEDLVSNLQTELQTANMELELSRRELENLRRVKEEAVADLEARIEALTATETQLRQELMTTTESYETRLSEKGQQETLSKEEITRLQNASTALQAHIETLKSELKVKDGDIFELSQTLEEEQRQLTDMRALLEVKDAEMEELKEALTSFEDEIKSFRNFEKQIKELRMAQIKGSNVTVTAEGDPDFTNWTEHELAELNTRLQSDLDTALYMLHQRDIRCDELTFELMQLLEERDTLQLRLSTVIRINEELRSLTSEYGTHAHDARQDNKDLIDQSNDRQARKMAKVPEEDLKQLALKISELHSVGYMKDKTIQDESMQRHREQMTLLGRVSDTDMSRDGQASPAAGSHWIRTGKAAPKVMHI